MSEVREILTEVQKVLVEELCSHLQYGLVDANTTLLNQGGGHSTNALQEQIPDVIERFRANLIGHFRALLGESKKELNVLDYGSLSLVEEEDLEAIIAMEGMISHARNSDLREYLRFNSRLDHLFYGHRIDESNNPMDPEQIGDAFKEAMRPLKLHSKEQLTVYREFNKHVFHNLEPILERGNDILVEHGVLPNLGLAARIKKREARRRSQPRPTAAAEERVFNSGEEQPQTIQSNAPQLFSMLQNLMHGMGGNQSVTQPPAQGIDHGMVAAGHAIGAGATPGAPAGLQPGMMVGGQRVELVASDKLINLLGSLHQTDKSATESEPLNLNRSVGQLLQEQSDDSTLQAIDSQASDVINLLTLLYEAIWQDETVPIPIKELIGRTQIPVLKIALREPHFFESDQHAARALLNELATAGIGWTESAKLDDDLMYNKMQALVARLNDEYDGDIEFVESLLQDFREFKREQLRAGQEAESALMDAEERRHRIEEVRKYAKGKILERILHPNIDPFVVEFLKDYFRQFVVQVLLKEGPGGISWKPVMNTIDVLLWTVNPDKREGDRERFVKVNPRLLVNLGKALNIAGIDNEKAQELIKRLKVVQDSCFQDNAQKPGATSDTDPRLADGEGTDAEAVSPSEPLPEDDEHLQEVSNYPLGIWLEFLADGMHTVRCTLAAKIDTIDSYVFVNANGVKVVEKTRSGLARELKAGTVKVISEAPLIDRAMESVIGKLRSQREVQLDENL